MEFRKQKLPKKFVAKNMNIRRQKQQQQQQQRNNMMKTRNKINNNDLRIGAFVQPGNFTLGNLLENLFMPFDDHNEYESLEFIQQMNDLKTPREKDDEQIENLYKIMNETETIIADTIEKQMIKESIMDENYDDEIEKIIDKIQKHSKIHDDE